MWVSGTLYLSKSALKTSLTFSSLAHFLLQNNIIHIWQLRLEVNRPEKKKKKAKGLSAPTAENKLNPDVPFGCTYGEAQGRVILTQ